MKTREGTKERTEGEGHLTGTAKAEAKKGEFYNRGGVQTVLKRS